MNSRTIARVAWVAVAVAAVLRVAVAFRLWQDPGDWVGDARVFLRITDGIRDGALVPDVWVWAPGYPLLGWAFSFFGGSGPGLVLASLVLGIATPALVLGAGLAAGRPLVAALAAIVIAFSPDLVLAAGSPLSDSAAIALVVGAIVLAEIAFRRGSLALGGIAGLVGGLAAITRPETLLATGPLLLFGLSRRRVAVAYALLLALTVLPYSAALHRVSGVWGLTLKPQLNIRKMAVYQSDRPYGEIRSAWGETLREFQDESGALDPRKLAGASSPRRFLLSGAAFEAWAKHFEVALGRSSPVVLALGVLGLAGLAWPGAPGTRERLLAALASLPFLAVPFFVAPIGRFVLPALPAVAWGLGTLAALLVEAAGDRRRKIAFAAAVLTAAAFGISGARTSWVEADRVGWVTRLSEIKAAVEESDPERALELLRPFLEEDPEDPELLDTLGTILEARGDQEAAEESFRQAVAQGAAPVRLANLLARTGRIGEAETLLAPLRDDPPEDPQYWMLLGNLAFLKERWDEADSSFRRAQSLGGPEQELAFNRGLALARAGRLAEARAELARAIDGPSRETATRARDLMARLEAPRPE